MKGGDLDALLAAAHVYEQRRVVAALLGTAARAAWRSRNNGAPRAPLSQPEGALSEHVTAPSRALVRDYARFAGAPADAYAHPSRVPGHMFPQWAFPLAARTLRPVPYPLARILNAGCRLEVNAPVPTSSQLTVRARLVGVDDDGRRALLHQRIETDTPEHPSAIVADLYAVAPYARARGPRKVPGEGDDAGRVPADARELGRCHFGPRAGLGFAFLTGDFNPIHWAPPFARAAGFATPILHGFAMMARAMEGLGRALYAGATDRIRVLDVKFKRPLLLGDGVDVGLYLDQRDPRAFYFAIAPGSRPHMVGRFEAREQRSEGAAPAITVASHQPAFARAAADHPQPAAPYAVGEAHA
jgi:acyl dehydratase